MAEKILRTERSESEMDTGGRGEAIASTECQSMCKKEHMTNIYLTVIVNFVKDHEELYDKIYGDLRTRTRKDCLWERFVSSFKLSVKVCKTSFESQRTRYGKLTRSKSGQTPKKMTERQNWIQDKFNFLKTNLRKKGLSKSSGFKSPQRGVSAITASAHHISRGSTDTDSLGTSAHSDTTH